jgi:O-antigen/teichoic acid export membrane protein
MRYQLKALGSLTDAGISSLGNAVLTVIGAHFLSPSDFGFLASYTMVGILVTGGSRVFLIDAFTLKYSATQANHRDRVAGAVLGSCFSSGLLLGTISVLVALFLGAMEGKDSLVALGVTFPLLVGQDSIRWICYARGDIRCALLNTSIWTVGTFSIVGLLIAFDLFSPATGLLAWGLSAGLGAASAMLLSGLRPIMRKSRSWLREARSIGSRTIVDFSLTQAIGPAGGLVIAAVSGAAAYGALRVAQLPLAAVQIAIMGTISLVQPLMVVHVSRRDVKGARRIALVAACGMIGVTVLVAAFAFLLPNQLMVHIFSEDWVASKALLPIAALSFIGGSLSAGYGPFLRAVGQLNFEVLAKATIAPVTLMLIVIGAWLFSLWGGAIAQALGALVLGAVTLARAMKRYDVSTVDHGVSE